MTLKATLTQASKFNDIQQTNFGYHAVTISDGAISATNGYVGCRLPCEEVDGIEAVVETDVLRKILTKVKDPKLRVMKPKGKRKEVLQLASGSLRFRLPLLPTDAIAKPPTPPAGLYAKQLIAAHVAQLSEMSSCVAPDAQAHTMSMNGLRLHPQWCAAVTNTTVVKLSTEGLVAHPVTVPSFLFDGIYEDVDIAVGPRRVWIRGRETKQLRWGSLLMMPFPDQGVERILDGSVAAAEAEGWLAEFEGKELVELAKQAEAVRGNKTIYQIQLARSGILLSTALGDNQFSGKIVAEINREEESPPLAISPRQLSDVLEAVMGYDPGDVQLGIEKNPLNPVTLKRVERTGLVMPMRLP